MNSFELDVVSFARISNSFVFAVRLQLLLPHSQKLSESYF
jgi:hypothetical protein